MNLSSPLFLSLLALHKRQPAVKKKILHKHIWQNNCNFISSRNFKLYGTYTICPSDQSSGNVYYSTSNVFKCYINKPHLSMMRNNLNLSMIRNNTNLSMIRNNINLSMIRNNTNLFMIRNNINLSMIRNNTNLSMIRNNTNLSMIRNNTNLFIIRNNTNLSMIRNNFIFPWSEITLIFS